MRTARARAAAEAARARSAAPGASSLSPLDPARRGQVVLPAPSSGVPSEPWARLVPAGGRGGSLPGRPAGEEGGSWGPSSLRSSGELELGSVALRLRGCSASSWCPEQSDGTGPLTGLSVHLVSDTGLGAL